MADFKEQYRVGFVSDEESKVYDCLEQVFDSLVAEGFDPCGVMETMLFYAMVRVHFTDDLEFVEPLIANLKGRAMEIREEAIEEDSDDRPVVSAKVLTLPSAASGIVH